MRLVPHRVSALVDRVTGRTAGLGDRGTPTSSSVGHHPAATGRSPSASSPPLEAVADVHGAVVNPFVDRVVVSYHDLWVTPEELVAVIEAVEAEFDLLDEGFPPDRADHPGDLEPSQRELVQLVSTITGMGTTVAGRVRIRRQEQPGPLAARTARGQHAGADPPAARRVGPGRVTPGR